MHDVEAGVRVRQGVHVADVEGDLARARPPCGVAGDLDDPFGPVEADDLPRGDARRQVDRDRSRAAADVEEALARDERREQVSGRVLGGAPTVRPQDGLVVAMGVLVLGAHPTSRGPGVKNINLWTRNLEWRDSSRWRAESRSWGSTAHGLVVVGIVTLVAPSAWRTSIGWA